jgi:Na+/H+ antiporter NhaD/arsenite permease-like protein
LLRANAHRRRRAHLAVFFIILVANAGGATLPLGPPLYIGFLRGVPFFWPVAALAGPLLVVAAPLLAVFYLVDRHHARREPPRPTPLHLHIKGGQNLPLVALVLGSVLSQLVGEQGTLRLLGQTVDIARLTGIAICLTATWLSLWITPKEIREENDFHWGPIHEVAVLFAGLFITIAPVLNLLAEGAHGPLATVFAITRDHAGAPIPLVYFWLSGLLSGFLDNAPTYLVFFQQAGGNVAELTGVHARTLLAISAGSVLFGGLSYIGNAPNLLVRAIAQHQGVRMPGFLVYVIIAACLLQPCFIAISLIFLW